MVGVITGVIYLNIHSSSRSMVNEQGLRNITVSAFYGSLITSFDNTDCTPTTPQVRHDPGSWVRSEICLVPARASRDAFCPGKSYLSAQTWVGSNCVGKFQHSCKDKIMVLLCMPVTLQQVLRFPLWIPAFGLPSTLPQSVPCYANEPFIPQITASCTLFGEGAGSSRKLTGRH